MVLTHGEFVYCLKGPCFTSLMRFFISDVSLRFVIWVPGSVLRFYSLPLFTLRVFGMVASFRLVFVVR